MTPHTFAIKCGTCKNWREYRHMQSVYNPKDGWCFICDECESRLKDLLETKDADGIHPEGIARKREINLRQRAREAITRWRKKGK